MKQTYLVLDNLGRSGTDGSRRSQRSQWAARATTHLDNIPIYEHLGARVPSLVPARLLLEQRVTVHR
jgi:hypothetical protein